ncbi:MAG: hypothetical protein IKU33_05005 [Bacteroidales bacterium]|nr:hypothetical protein [Bacteroidales bacterium]
MKLRIIIGIILLFSATSVFAQYDKYNPTTTWPYMYADFAEGELKMNVGNPKVGKYNVHLLKGTLHFIEGDLIREANSYEVFSVKIGNDYYANAGGRMMKVVAKNDNGFIAEETLANIAELNNTGGAYGSSSNSLSTQALSSMEGIGGTRSNMNHMELKNAKGEGEILPVTVKTYIVVPGYCIFAAKKDVSDLYGIDKKELNTFLKENSIKWKDPQSLLILVDFLAERLN